MSKLNVVNTSHLNYWKLLSHKWKPSRKHSYPLNVNGRPIHDNRIKCNLFNEYFTSISNSPRNDFQTLPPLEYLTDQQLLSPVIEPFEVFQVLHRLNPNKCKGFDNLPNRILKICSQSLATPFSLLFNFILSSDEYPSLDDCDCNTLLKTGSQTEVQNYCPIALLPSLSKVFEKLLHKHIYNYLEHHKSLIPNNSGFRKKHSTLNSLLAIVCTKLLIQISPLE